MLGRRIGSGRPLLRERMALLEVAGPSAAAAAGASDAGAGAARAALAGTANTATHAGSSHLLRKALSCTGRWPSGGRLNLWIS